MPTIQSYISKFTSPTLTEAILRGFDITMNSPMYDYDNTNEYFKSVKQPKLSKKSFDAKFGNGRVAYRHGVGRGSLSYDPAAIVFKSP